MNFTQKAPKLARIWVLKVKFEPENSRSKVFRVEFDMKNHLFLKIGEKGRNWRNLLLIFVVDAGVIVGVGVVVVGVVVVGAGGWYWW